MGKVEDDGYDAAQASALLGQAKGSTAGATAGGAYDGEPVHRAVAARQPEPRPEVVVPPRASAVPTTDDLGGQTPRGRHIRLMAETGRMGRQRAGGHGRRDHVGTTTGRHKH